MTWRTYIASIVSRAQQHGRASRIDLSPHITKKCSGTVISLLLCLSLAVHAVAATKTVPTRGAASGSLTLGCCRGRKRHRRWEEHVRGCGRHREPTRRSGAFRWHSLRALLSTTVPASLSASRVSLVGLEAACAASAWSAAVDELVAAQSHWEGMHVAASRSTSLELGTVAEAPVASHHESYDTGWDVLV